MGDEERPHVDLGLVARGRDEDHELVAPVVHDVGDREDGRLLLNERPGALVAAMVASHRRRTIETWTNSAGADGLTLGPTAGDEHAPRERARGVCGEGPGQTPISS
jgi:hypothetical protein